MGAGSDHAEWGDGAGDGDLEMRIAVWRQMQPRLVHLEPIGLHGDRLFAFQQPHNGVHRFQHARPLRRWLDPQHVSIRGQRARPAAQHGTASGHVIELNPALCHQEWT